MSSRKKIWLAKFLVGKMSSRPFWYFVWKALCNRQIDMAPFFYGFVSATCNTIKIKKSQSLPYIYLSQKAAPHVREKVYIDKIPQFWCLDSGSISSNKALTKFERSSRKKVALIIITLRVIITSNLQKEATTTLICY